MTQESLLWQEPRSSPASVQLYTEVFKVQQQHNNQICTDTNTALIVRRTN